MLCSLHATGRYMYMPKRIFFEFPDNLDPDEVAHRASSGSTEFAL